MPWRNIPYGPQHLCTPRRWCFQKCLTFSTTLASMLCMAILLGRIAMRHWRRRPGPDTAIGRLIRHLVVVICVVDFCYHTTDLAYAMDEKAPPHYFMMREKLPMEYVHRVAYYQFARECFGMMSVFWHCTIARCMYSWVVLKRSAQHLRYNYLGLQICAALMLSTMRYLIFVTLALQKGVTEAVGTRVPGVSASRAQLPGRGVQALCLLCTADAQSITGSGGPTDTRNASSLTTQPEPDIEMGGTKVEEKVSEIVVPPPVPRDRAIHSFRQIINRLMRICLVVSVVWVVGNTADLLVWTDWLVSQHVANVGFFITRIITLKIVGTVDALILGDMGTGMQRRTSRPHSSSYAQRHSGSIRRIGSFMQKRRRATASDPHAVTDRRPMLRRLRSLGYPPLVTPPGQGPPLRLFATTWNMGGQGSYEVEAQLPAVLSEWIPLGYDMYTVAVQECTCLKEIRALIWSYLGGPDAYCMFKEALGDARLPALHGVIGLLVFARAQDAEEGAFEAYRGFKYSTGVKLGPMGRVPNKGVVGMSARYYDTNLALISAHLAADIRGKTRLRRRHQDAIQALQGLSLVQDSEEFDVHHQHHHTVLLGDLNFRLTGSPAEVMNAVSQSAAAAVRRYGDHWRAASYSFFHTLPAIPVGTSTRHSEQEYMEWEWIYRLDELSKSIRQERVFFGFREGRIAFPPSYRWREGCDAGDFTDVDLIQSCAYKISTEEPCVSEHRPPLVLRRIHSAPEIEKQPDVEPNVKTAQQRTPSYTDRVLTHSLPGRVGRLKWRHYDMADAIMLSDHRPVAAACEMTVDRKVIPARDFQRRSSSAVAAPTWDLHGEKELHTVRIYVRDLELEAIQVHLSHEKITPSMVVILYPIPSEDPLAGRRQTAALHEVVSAPPLLFRRSASSAPEISGVEVTDRPNVPATIGGDAMQVVRRGQRSIPWTGFPARHRVVVDYKLSQHMLIKIRDARGHSIGQAVVVVQSFESKDIDSVKVPLTSGGALTGWLKMRIRVKRDLFVENVASEA